jgi:hypothetical protein
LLETERRFTPAAGGDRELETDARTLGHKEILCCLEAQLFWLFFSSIY